MKRPTVLCFCLLIVLCAGLTTACGTPRQQSARPATQCQATLQPAPDNDGWIGTQTIDYCLPANLDALLVWVGCGIPTEVAWNDATLQWQQEGEYATVWLGQELGKGSIGRLTIRFRVPLQQEIIQDYLPFVCAYNEGFICNQRVDFAPYVRLDSAQCTLQWQLPITRTGCHTGRRTGINYTDDAQVQTYTLAAGHHTMMVSARYMVHTQSTPNAQLVMYENTQNQLSRAPTMVQNAAAIWGEIPPIQMIYAATPLATEGLVLANEDKFAMCLGIVCQWILPHVAQLADWVLPSLAHFYRWYYYLRTDPNVAARLHAEAVEQCRLYSALWGQNTLASTLPLSDYTAQSYDILLGRRGLLMWYALYQMRGDDLMDALVYALEGQPTPDLFWQKLNSRLAGCQAYCQPWLEGKVPIL